MNLTSIGHQVRQRRREKKLTVAELAASAGVGRSTLAALEAGKLSELGFVKVARICAAVGLVLEARPLELDAPLMPHRHLTDAAGRDLTNAAIADIIVRGDTSAWRGLIRTIRNSKDARLAHRTRDVVAALDREDAKVRAFATLLPAILGEPHFRPEQHA